MEIIMFYDREKASAFVTTEPAASWTIIIGTITMISLKFTERDKKASRGKSVRQAGQYSPRYLRGMHYEIPVES